MRASLQQKSRKTGMENIAAVRTLDQLLGAAAGATLSTEQWLRNTNAPSLAHPIRTGIDTAHEGCQWAQFVTEIVVGHETFSAFYVFTGEEKIS